MKINYLVMVLFLAVTLSASLVIAESTDFTLGVQSQTNVDKEVFTRLKIQNTIGKVQLNASEISEKIRALEESVAVKIDPSFDEDKDGIDDRWETVFFGDFKENSPVKIQSRIRVMAARGEENLPRLTIMSNGDLLADTDGDGVSDKLESVLGTYPTQDDTDQDGIKDSIEAALQLDPKLSDSDGDGFTDAVEVNEGTDPKNTGSFSVDVNNNKIADSWEARFGLINATGLNDLDGDGLSNKLEYRVFTDPTKIDSDEDGISDLEEVYDYNTDPLVKNELKYLSLNITNWTFQEKTPDSKPVFKGIGRAGERIQLLIDDLQGKTAVLATDRVSDNGRFLIRPQSDVKNGFFVFLVQEFDQEGRVLRTSNRVQLAIDNTVIVPRPEIEMFDGIEVKSLITNVELKTINNKPVIAGRVFPRAKVYAYWKSLLLTSAVLADYQGDYFEIAPPKDLDVNSSHSVVLYALKDDEGLRSPNVDLNFRVEKSEVLESSGWQKEELALAIVIVLLLSLLVVFFVMKKLRPSH